VKPAKRHVFAIIRYDTYLAAAIENAVSVTRIAMTLQRAESEVARLNALNGGKGSRYFWQTTRLEADDGDDEDRHEG